MVPGGGIPAAGTPLQTIQSPGPMKNNTAVLLMLAIMFAVPCTSAVATDTIPLPARHSSFELLPVFMPWTGTSNPGALSEYNISNVSLMQVGYLNNDDEIRLIQHPEQTEVYHASTKGYMKIGDLSVFGSFGYSSSRYNGSAYNGTLMFDTYNPYLIGDTVAARQFREQFDVGGKISYRLNERITLATGVDYTSAVGAKQKDPRNKNSISLLKLTPGVVYHLGRTSLGLSGTWYTTSNELSYSVEGNWNQTLFMPLGLGYYRREVNISSYSQWYTGKGYAGAVQASHETDNLFILAEAKYDHFNEEARSGSSFRLIDGITGTDNISLSGLLRLAREKAYHTFTVEGSLKALSADEILQRSYTVNKGTYSYDSLATVSWIENKHMINDINGSLGYSYLLFDSEHTIDFSAGGEVSANYFSTEHFPVQSYGQYNVINLRGTLFATKLLHIGSLNLTPGIEASYQANLASDISYTIQANSLPEMVYHDFYVSRANIFSGTLSLRVEKQVTRNKFIKSLFIIPEGRMVMAPGTEAGDLSGYMVRASAGIIF